MRNERTPTLPCGRPLPKDPAPDAKGAVLYEATREKLHAFTGARGLRRSSAREKILRTIVYEARHFRAPELLRRLKKRHPEVGKATLYRNLPVLVESGVLREGPTDAEGRALYELSEDGEHHDHIVCTDCGRIFEFHDRAIETRQGKISGRLGFDVKSHQHVVYATCRFLEG